MSPVMAEGGRFDRAGFAQRVEAVERRIEGAAADPSSVRVVAVTKGFGPEAVAAAVAAGFTDIGENYADELVDKAGAVEGGRLPRCGTSSARCSATRWPGWLRWSAGGKR